MAIASGLPSRVDVSVVAGDAFSFSFTLNQNLTGVSLTATLYYWAPQTVGQQLTLVSQSRAISHSVTGASAGNVTVSLTTSDTNDAQLVSAGGCPAWWVLKSSTKTYCVGNVYSGSLSGCDTISSLTVDNAVL